jgi:hypothetical protein
MPYPYGMQNAPVVGNGLGGLPRRTTAVVAAPVVAQDPIGPYILSTFGNTYTSYQFAYSPLLSASTTYTISAVGGQLIHSIRYGTFNYVEKTFQGDQMQTKTPGGNSTYWQTSLTNSGMSYASLIKHDCTGLVSMWTGNYVSARFNNTACYETVNGVDSFYFMTYSGTTMQLSKKENPNYATQAYNETGIQLTFAVNSSGRIPYAMFINGDYLYVICGHTPNARILLDRFNKSDLTYSNTVYWNVTDGIPPQQPTFGCVGETATTLAIKFTEPSGSDLYARAFIIDKSTLLAWQYLESTLDVSPHFRLINNSEEIYGVVGGTSGGSYGQTNVRIFRPTQYIDVGQQVNNVSSSSLAQQVHCATPKGYSWNTYYPSGGGGSNANYKMIWVPSSSKTFSYSNGNFAFYQTWGVTSRTPVAGTAISLALATAGNQFTAQFTAFNPLGTTYIS